MGARSLAWIGLALTVVGIATGAWAADQLAEGIREIPQHWWSAAAIVPLVAGLALTALALARSRD